MDDDQERELEALEGILSDPNAEPIRLSYGLLKFITDNFSHEIGRGGFAVVYQGDLRNGVVAVKRSNGLYITDKQFMDEIKCLKSANHKNIVRFLGYCADTQEEVMPLDGTFVMAGERNRLFCFECVPNGNIRQYLEQEKSHGDDWSARYQMIRGICQGLKYLHDKKINHRDLKPENVLLDADMKAKIADFGLSRFLDQGKSQIITQQICGTLRYIAPEVIDRRELSLGSDIYALGVIIIELLTGTSMISLENWDESLDLPDCPRAMLCTEIARNCTDAKRDNRPTIHEVIHCMDKLESTIPVSSTTHQLVTATAFPGTQLLDVYPQELRFLFVPDKGEMSCSLTLINKTDGFVYCLVTSRDSDKLYEYILPPMSSSVGQLYMNSEEEIPSNMVEWEILMFTTLFDSEEHIDSGLSELDKGMPLEDKIKVLQELFGGELHRAALTASVIVGSEVLRVHHIGIHEVIHLLDVHWLDVHPSEPWVLLRAAGTVYIWNWQSNEEVGKYHVGEYYSSPRLYHRYGKPSKDYSMAIFIARERWVVMGNSDGYITVRTCPTMDHVDIFKAHDDTVCMLAVHPTRPFLLSFSYPRSLKLWNWSSSSHPTRLSKLWSCTRIFDVKSRLTQIMFNPKDTTTFATLGEDGLVQMWKIGHLNSVAKTHSRDWRESSDLFTYTGNRDCVASVRELCHNISIWDLRKEKHVHTLRNPLYEYTLAVCHPTLPILVTVSRPCSAHSWSWRIEVWDSATYRLKKAYDNLPEHVVDVGFTGSRLVIGYNKGYSVLDIDLE